MSVSSSPLRTVLLQRLDTMLGTNLSRQTQLINRNPSSPVAQIGEADSPGAIQQQHQEHPEFARSTATRPPGPQAQSIRGSNTDRSPQAPAATPAGTGEGASASASLGKAARLILALLDIYPESPPPIQTQKTLFTPGQALQPALATLQAGVSDIATASQATPTPVSGQRADTQLPVAPLFAQALRNTLDQSGLFYESHLQQAYTGKRPLIALSSEPQANFPANSAQSQPGNPLTGLATDTHLLLRQQLDILANDTLLLKAEAWPGTDLEWEVQRRSHEEAASASSPEPGWASRLTLQMNRLGSVEVRLQLQDNHLQLQIVAPQASGQLRAAAPQLQHQLHTAGLHIQQLSVRESA